MICGRYSREPAGSYGVFLGLPETGPQAVWCQWPSGSGYGPLSKDNHNLLVKNQDGSWEITFQDHTRRLFSSAGKLVADVDRNGNQTSYAYNGSGSLSEVSNGSRSVFYSYGTRSDGQPVSIRALNASTGPQTQLEY